ncbi:MAG TPA: hypothetical protein VMB50_13445 [Myxococcales bacterium]|nr:hypothetical protein [Myxococcales bacterium]
MSQLVECARCGGLKRADNGCCPHCHCKVAGWRTRLARWMAVVAPSLVVACGPLFLQPPVPLYGGILLPDAGDGRVPGPDSGRDGSFSTLPDAYGAIVLPEDAGDGGPRDGGVADAGDGGPTDGGWSTAVDAYGIPPMRDSGTDSDD